MTIPHEEVEALLKEVAYHKKVSENQRANLASVIEYEKANPWGAAADHVALSQSIEFHQRLADALEALSAKPQENDRG